MKDNKYISIIVVGATGNLAQKYLWQSLFNIYLKQEIRLKIFATARDSSENGKMKIYNILSQNITCNHSSFSNSNHYEFCNLMHHQFQNDIFYMPLRGRSDYQKLKELLETFNTNMLELGRLFYLAIPPHAYGEISEYINQYLRPIYHSKTNPWLRILLEKPFGNDLISAKKLEGLLRKSMKGEEIYLVDHYMGKLGVQSILLFRHFNQLKYNSLWNSKHISNIDISLVEIETCVGRTSYYDTYGVIRDVMQNHATLLSSLVGMPITQSMNHHDHLESRIEFIKGLTLNDWVVGQYQGYDKHRKKESDCSRETCQINQSTTPTAASIIFSSKLRNWDTTYFILSAGKAMNMRYTTVRVHFSHDSDGLPYSSNCEIIFGIQEDKYSIPFIEVCKELPSPDLPKGWKYDANNLYRIIPEDFWVPNAYESLLTSALHGDRSSFISLTEVLKSWELWTPILESVNSATMNNIFEYPQNDVRFLERNHEDAWGCWIHSSGIPTCRSPRTKNYDKDEL